ncbi:paraspeckle component 1-like isoform X3 [Pomacea canaliculata]|uniref:paraspeckle component 1-like isoform X3 n=1 Tax=Pomacea canaliculata TaxID=400727 RepID=UPI000D7306D5|nr:paraspeckle component 1-like isoform X3 [Pomacea canaliculata]
MSKTSSKNSGKVDNRDHKRESSGGRNDKSHSKSDSSSKNSLKQDEKDTESMLASEANSKDKDGDSKAAEEKKFTGRCRLFVGNLTPDVTEDDFKKMFEPYGEISEVYVNTGRGFGFIRLDYRQNAEAAKAALDGLQRKGRILRVRFATHGAALRVKNLHPYVSNELLERAFSQFGELERAIVIVDDRGKPTGEGLIEFVRKPGAQQALRRINEGVFLLGIDPKPIEVEPLEQKDEEDGMPEKFLPRNEQYKKEREKEPRFAPPGSFEYEFGMRWKQLDEMEHKRIEQVKKDTEEARIKLEDEMQNALYEYQAEQIRQDLLRQQEELRRLEELRNKERMRRQQELEMRWDDSFVQHYRRQEEERQRQAEERRRQEMMIRQQEMSGRRGVPQGPLEPGMRGGPGGPLEQGLRGREEMMGGLRGEGGGFPQGPGMRGSGCNVAGGEPVGMRGGRGAPPLQPPPAPPAGMGLERGGPLGQASMGRMQAGGGPGVNAGGNFAGQGANVNQAGHPGMGGASPSSGGPGMGGSPNINNMGGPGGPGQQMRQSRFDQVPSPFDPSFSSRGSMGGAAGGQGGVPGGVGGPGGSPGMFGSPSQMNPMGRPDRGMMDRRRDAPMQHDDLAEMKRMRRF